MIYDNKIIRGNFFNIVEIVCKIFDLDFVEKFIVEYLVKLLEEDFIYMVIFVEVIVLFIY